MSLIKLGTAIEVVMGQAPPSQHCNADGEGEIFVKAGEFGEKNPSIREWTTNPLKMARADDTLLCVVGATCGKTNMASFDCAIGRSVAAIRPIKAKIDKDFLYHFLGTQVKRLRDRSQGAAQGVITKEMIFDIELMLPPLAQQQRIAAILDKAAEIKAKREQAIAKLDELAQSTFVEMFGDVKTNSKNWNLQKLDEIFELKNGINFSSEQKGNGTLTVDVSNMYADGVYVDTTNLYRVDAKITADRILKNNDLLFVRSSVKQEGVAWATLYKQHIEDVTYCGFLIRARLMRINIELQPQYLVYFLRQKAIRQQLIAKAGKMAITNINQERLGSLKISIPPINLQKEFGGIIDKLDAMKRNHKSQLAKQVDFIKSLQHQAFTTGFNA
jgi:restriction endonuclease S subunit